MKIEIKNRWNGAVIFAHEAEENSVAITINKMVIDARADLTRADLTRADLTRADLTRADLTRADLTDADLTRADLTDANLTRANLTRADLTDADLTEADLTRANLTDANLTRADLTEADLTDANLTRADLTEADLTEADLTRADLTEADLTRANLTDANLTRADLTRADLTDADLTYIRDDIWAVLSSAPLEVAALIDALKSGRVDGSTYSGECSCLVGTIGRIRGVDVYSLGSLVPNSARASERFFMAISKGDTPETNQVSKLACQWAEEWLANMRAAFQVPAESAA